MSYADLHRLGVVVRPIVNFGPEDLDRRRSPFSSTFSNTIALLKRELVMLGAERIVLGLDLPESKIRADGLPRADAKADSPRVQLAFTTAFNEPLVFNVDAFIDWRDNIRAIALGLESLRRVDRYGITRSGEQYRGWKQLPMSTDPADAIQTREQAQAVLDAHGGLGKAIRATHPDTGGDPVEFRKVMRAREVLGA